MESSNVGHYDVEGVLSDRELLGFDFLANQIVSDSDGSVGAGVTDQSFTNDGSVVEDTDDGFLTPTSIDRKIKMIKTCPPAPRKPPPPPSRKRKALFPVDQSGMVADLAAEIAKLSPEKKARVLTVQATVM